MITTKELNDIINGVAPYELAVEWDNCGLLFDCALPFDKALFALDVTNEAVAEAKRLGCGAIVSHHPAIMGAVKALAAPDPVVTAAMAQISLFAAHTCFDFANDGVNDVMCSLLGITDVQPWPPIGRTGHLKSGSAEALAARVKSALGCARVLYVDGGAPIERVAVVCGSAGDLVADAKWAGCDAFITGELKHHDALFARQIGLSVVAAGHFATEVIAIKALRDAVQKAAGDKLKCVLFEGEPDPLNTI